MGTMTISLREPPKANRRGYISPKFGEYRPAKRPKHRAQKRLIEEAKEYFKEHDIDFSQFEAGIEMTDCTCLCDVVFCHKKTGAIIRLTEVWFKEETGEILQAGSHYGELVM